MTRAFSRRATRQLQCYNELKFSHLLSAYWIVVAIISGIPDYDVRFSNAIFCDFYVVVVHKNKCHHWIPENWIPPADPHPYRFG